MDGLIISIYRFSLRIFVIAVVIGAFAIGAMISSQMRGDPAPIVFAVVGAVVVATILVGHFLTVLAIRDGIDEQNRRLASVYEAINDLRLR